MSEELKGLSLPVKEFEGVLVYELALRYPPAFFRAIARSGNEKYLGVWFDLGKVCVSDGRSSQTSSNSVWQAFWSHPVVMAYIYGLSIFGSGEIDLYGDMSTGDLAKHGFLLVDGTVYLSRVRSIVEILEYNPDTRPDWGSRERLPKICVTLIGKQGI